MTKPLIPAPWSFDAPGKLRLVDVRTDANLASHADAWAGLLLQSPAVSPMLSFPQVSAFFETQISPSETWLCLFAYEDERLLGVLPLIAARTFGLPGLSILLLKTPYDILHTSGVDCLTLHGREEIIEVFVAYLSGIPGTWPVIRMRELPDHSPSMVYFKRHNTKLRAVHRPCGCENYIEVPKSYEAYHAGLSSNFRRQLKRGARKLEELDDIRFLCPEHSRPAAENVGRFEEIEASGWKGKQEFTIKSAQRSAAFFTLVAERFRNHGWMEWNFLDTGERTIAAHFGVRINRTLFLLKISYDDEFSACSPGNLLLSQVIQHASETGSLDEINCVADCAWHKNWNMKKRLLHDLIILPRIPFVSALLSSILNSEAFHYLKERFSRNPVPANASCPETTISPY